MPPDRVLIVVRSRREAGTVVTRVERDGDEVASSPALRATAAYDESTSVIAGARDFVTAFLHRARGDGVAVAPRQFDAARLVVNELVTSAVRHAPGPAGSP
jgi:hypothetical protein